MADAHISVLPDEVLEALLPGNQPIQNVIDGTLGAGGHTRLLLEAGVQRVLGLDLDPAAIAIARQNLAAYTSDQVHIVQTSYADMRACATELGWQSVDGILLDLGVSSMQVDTPERGFAFMQDGPLDMRFNPHGDTPPAVELVNHWDDRALSDIFWRYGEERHSRHLARAIVEGRPFETTTQLAAFIKAKMPTERSRRSKQASQGKSIHPATRVFQALRIAVNDELRTIEDVLPIAIGLLKRGGRLAVISFHSLEDRIVKQVFKEASTEIVSPPGMVLEEKQAKVRLVTRKPITPSQDEIACNPRSRSAKMRVVEKL